NPRSTFIWDKKLSAIRIEEGGAPSDFPSLYLNGKLRSKPDVSALGGNSLSTYPSMAILFVIGAPELYMQAKGAKACGEEIRKVFKNTATITKSPGFKTFASAAKQGGGLINVLKTPKATVSISPDYMDLLDTKHIRKTVKTAVKNSGEKVRTYTLSHIPADAFISYLNKNLLPLNIPLIEVD
ncbi:hypothetical protein BG011_002433, partial [Mortierella polycephala]